MPRGFYLVIAAQFLSALADNALLIVTIALLHAQGYSGWWAPMLKFGFTLAYVFLAPGVGDLADAVSKARLMGWMNGVKMLGAITLLISVHPVLAFSLVGLGAAAYAPAKYGLITEMIPARRLVAANGWIEVSAVGAALLGTALGGALVSQSWLESALARSLALWGRFSGSPDSPLTASVACLVVVYLLASLLNRGIPNSHARYPSASIHPMALLRAFRQANRTLWLDREGALSLAATTLFWGVGATLQFMVLRWAELQLGLSLSQAAYLQGAVAIGMVTGAALAGRFVPITHARKALGVGILLGLMMPVIASVSSLTLAALLLIVVGTLGGLMVVPLNALLQHRGCVLLSAGRSIAVQGFNENASVLVMLATYAALVAADVPIVPLMWLFGLAIASGVAAIMWVFRAEPARPGGGEPPRSDQ